MAVARVSLDRTDPRTAAAASATRSSSTSARTRRCCARAARRCCACSSRRTARWARACTRSRPARSSTSARSSTRSGACPTAIAGARARGHGPGGRGLRAQRHRRSRTWQEAEAPARRRRWYDDGDGHAGGAARQRLGPRRPDPDARRLPDRVEQAARAPARGRLAAGRQRADAGGVRRSCSAAAPTTGRGCADAWGERVRRAPAADRRAAAEPARADARRHARRLRADDPALVGAGARRARRRRR